MASTNKQVILDLIEQVWRQGRMDALPRFWSPDCVNHADAAAHRIGLEALRRYHEGFAVWFREFDEIRIAVDQQIADNNRVVTQMTTSAVHRSTGRPVVFGSIRIDRLSDGLIAEHWSIADTDAVRRQLG